MRYCTRCGHELGAGRYCTNCGQPVDVSDTAERPAGSRRPPAPSPPPTIPPAAPTSRYPLFADEVQAELPGGAPAPPADASEPAEEPASHDGHDGAGGQHGARHAARRTPGWLVPAVLALVLVVVAALGFTLLTGGDEERDPSAEGTTSTSPDDPAGSDSGSEESTPSQSPSPSLPSGPADLARFAATTVPDTAPPSTDLDGNRTLYEARQMLDGVPSTCWRMRGDASGEELVFVLPEPATLTRVGLINGYAKTEAGSDWYAGNRRVDVVEWIFDDGSKVRQELDDTREMQTILLEAVTTEEVRLRLVSVSRPGKGKTKRDYTAISDVSILGSVTG